MKASVRGLLVGVVLLALTATAGATSYMLQVSSTNPSSGVPISSSNGYGGTTFYTKIVEENLMAYLTAPEYHGTLAQRKRFTHWSGDASSVLRTFGVIMYGPVSVWANYVDDPVTYRLDVTSNISGVPITSVTGFGGTTDYWRSDIVHGTQVVLTAPEFHGTANRYWFTHWEGYTVGQRTISFGLGGNLTRRALYVTQDITTTPIYRFYSPVSGSHFYTRSESEKNNIIANLSQIWTYEGTAWHANAAPGGGRAPIYRFYSPVSGSHFYTRSESEKNNIIANLSHIWTYEGIAWYAFATQVTGSTPIYRFYSPVSGSHFYTRNQAERDHIIANLSQSWTYEGISYYAFAAPQSNSLGGPDVADAMAAPGPAAPDFASLAPSALTGVGPVNVVGDEAAGGVFFPLTMDDTFVTAAVYDPAAAAWDQVLPVTWAPGGIACANLRRGQPYWLAILAHEAETETWVFEHGSWFGRRTAPAADVAVLDEAPTALGLPIETIRLPEADAPLTLQLYCPIEERNVLTATGLESGSAYDLTVPAWNRQYRLDVFDAHGELVLSTWLGHLRTH